MAEASQLVQESASKNKHIQTQRRPGLLRRTLTGPRGVEEEVHQSDIDFSPIALALRDAGNCSESLWVLPSPIRVIPRRRGVWRMHMQSSVVSATLESWTLNAQELE